MVIVVVLSAVFQAVQYKAWVSKIHQHGCDDGCCNDPEWRMRVILKDDVKDLCDSGCMDMGQGGSVNWAGSECERMLRVGATQVKLWFKGEEDDCGGGCDHCTSGNDDDCMHSTECSYDINTMTFNPAGQWTSGQCKHSDTYVEVTVEEFTPSPTPFPSLSPTRPTVSPTSSPTVSPTLSPTTSEPSSSPSYSPTTSPPSVHPTVSPSASPTLSPTRGPTTSPTKVPTVSPSVSPTVSPTSSPTSRPSRHPTVSPSTRPTWSPTVPPTSPTLMPTSPPTLQDNSILNENTMDVTASLSALGASDAGGLALLGYAKCGANNEGSEEVEEPLPRSLHPLGFTLGGSVYLGAVIGNAIVCIFIFILQRAALAWLRRLDVSGDGTLADDELPKSFFWWRRDLEAGPQDLRGLLRYPGTTWQFYLVLHQGSCFAALKLITGQRSMGLVVTGGITTAGLVGVSCALLKMLRVGVNAAFVKEWPVYPVGPVKEGRPNVCVTTLLWGKGEWVSKTRENHWGVAWQSVARTYRTDAVWHGVCALLTMQWTLALASAFPMHTQVACGHQRSATGLSLLAYSMWTLGRMPFRIPADNYFAAVAGVLQAFGVFSIAAQYYSFVEVRENRICGDTCESFAFTFLTLGVYAILARVIFNQAGTIALIVSGRRSRLQHLQWTIVPKRAQSAAKKAQADIAPGSSLREANNPLLGPELGPEEGSWIGRPQESTPALSASLSTARFPCPPNVGVSTMSLGPSVGRSLLSPTNTHASMLSGGLLSPAGGAHPAHTLTALRAQGEDKAGKKRRKRRASLDVFVVKDERIEEPTRYKF
eukprot:Hpha_TRINITY_DN3926_c0_g1::TRINITY_DN3926_c0_g1_i1::g.18021::m.18021